MRDHQISLISGNAHPKLAAAIGKQLGVQPLNVVVGRFPDGEIDVKVLDDLRGTDCFILQPTSPPVNDHLMELLLLIDTCVRASAGRITAVIPYYGYARKDRKDEGRVPISAKLVANMIGTAGADRVLTIDLHAAQIQGFFDIPVDHLYAKPVLVEYFKELPGLEDPVVVAPDMGGLKRARAYAETLETQVAIIDKRRLAADQVAWEHMIGEVRNRDAIIVDDMITTGGSMVQAVRIVREHGARRVYVGVTHGVFCKDAVQRLADCNADGIVTTDTVPSKDLPEQFHCRSIAPLLASAIDAIHNSKSVSALFEARRAGEER